MPTRALIKDIASGITHWAIPPEEQVHLLKTAHHGYKQGALKCSGIHALCARCLQAGAPKEECATHTHHDCPAAKEVWKSIAGAWLAATGERLDIEDPVLTVMGLRRQPDGWGGDALEKWKKLEAPWRVLHSVTLLQIYRARCRVHAAFHAAARAQANTAEPRHILRETRRRVQQRLTYEHDRANYAATHGQQQSARSDFHNTWVGTGFAVMTKHGPRLALFSQAPPDVPLTSGTLHVRTAGVLAKTKKSISSGWAIAVARVQPDGSEVGVLTASGAVPATSTHAKTAPPHAEAAHTVQAARQAAVEAALAFAAAATSKRNSNSGDLRVAITVDGITTLRDLHRAQAHVREKERREAARRAAGARERTSGKRKREEAAAVPGSGEARTTWRPRAAENTRKLTKLKGEILIRAPRQATPLILIALAQEAAWRHNTNAEVSSAKTRRNGPLWSGNEIWDPGD